MKKINLAITGCMGRMGQQLIRSVKKNRKKPLVVIDAEYFVKLHEEKEI